MPSHAHIHVCTTNEISTCAMLKCVFGNAQISLTPVHMHGEFTHSALYHIHAILQVYECPSPFHILHACNVQNIQNSQCFTYYLQNGSDAKLNCQSVQILNNSMSYEQVIRRLNTVTGLANYIVFGGGLDKFCCDACMVFKPQRCYTCMQQKAIGGEYDTS